MQTLVFFGQTTSNAGGSSVASLSVTLDSLTPSSTSIAPGKGTLSKTLDSLQIQMTTQLASYSAPCRPSLAMGVGLQ